MKYNRNFKGRNPSTRGSRSKTRPGHEDYETDAGSEYFTRGGHRMTKRPFGRMARTNPDDGTIYVRRGVKPGEPMFVDNPPPMSLGSESDLTAIDVYGIPDTPLAAFAAGYHYGLDEGIELCPAKWLPGKKGAELRRKKKDLAKVRDEGFREQARRKLAQYRAGYAAQVPTVRSQRQVSSK